MTDNEIKKAFEVLDSWQRVAFDYSDGTDKESPKLFNAIKTIKECFNRQQAEIEKLKKAVDIHKEIAEDWKYEVKRLKEIVGKE